MGALWGVKPRWGVGIDHTKTEGWWGIGHTISSRSSSSEHLCSPRLLRT